MWKDRRPTGHKLSKDTPAEEVIDQRNNSILELLDELVSGTQELKALYIGDKKNERPKPA